jgi:hypothetical protein
VSEPFSLLYGCNNLLGRASSPSSCRIERAERDLRPYPITLLPGGAYNGFWQ